MAEISLKESFDRTRDALTGHFTPDEALSLARAVYADILGYTPVDIVLRKDTTISDFTVKRIDEVIKRLLADEPLQYITGHARFFGNDLEVTPAVLIPRPETEELVDMIVKDADGRSDLKVFDVCTGSGCIAVSLARALKFPQVDAADISSAALEVARLNASRLKVKVNFSETDALSMEVPAEPCYDIIVSNPPYVLEREAATMDPNVLKFEPHDAIFVPDSDPLRFYRAIGAYATKALRPGGKLYFEINPLELKPLCDMLSDLGLIDVQSVADMTGRQRFVVADSPADD